MKVTENLTKRWKAVKSRGDIGSLAVILKKDRSTVSRILSGTQETTADILIAIDEFYAKRITLLKKIKA